ncbi:MAG: efflux RND transporter periplasmic adaptor subunit [Deltaproteobacteria bacterium]|nr:efflux RND transporter periplasmic adaptor subunit [Deltaproteobacteria bacterium]MCB9478953.1 efflux RND transporter periplasmic adaptor subunit [Deltaproteobacteria bacterium]MCB9487842.1 efflux RND transporter periplasmic adaptor subunit [Deltaproteobacteria bacterium]
MKSLRVSRLALVLPLILGVAIVLAAGGQTRSEPAPPTFVKKVRVADVTRTDPSRARQFSGVVRAEKRAQLSFTLPGRMNERFVDVGDHVTKGQRLARLDQAELINAVDMANARVDDLSTQLDQARRDTQRAETLASQGGTSQQHFEQAQAGTRQLEAGLRAAQAQLREARRLLTESNLRAPFDGEVTDVFAEAGEFVAPGRPVLSLNGAGAEVEIEVPESMIGALKIGAPVTLRFPLARHDDVSGTVRSVGMKTAMRGRLFPVVVTIDPEAKVVPGMTVELSLTTASRDVLSVPVEAVINPGGHTPAVFAVRDQQAHRVDVRVGELIEGRVAVEGSLSDEDVVVVAGHSGLLDGDEVEVMP